jgi:tyrosine decarboxylase/aspartate 1-decarboxylase
MLEENGMAATDVTHLLQSLLADDATYASGRPVASMSTAPHGLGVEVFLNTMEKNAGRFHTFPGSAKIERQLLEMIGDLLHLARPYGTTTSGGTESNILAMLACREIARKKAGPLEIVAPETVHASVDKAAWILGMKLVKTKVDKQFKAVPDTIERAIGPNTVGIFATAGTTYLGQVDPIEEIGGIAGDHRIPLHVDAAFGGFVIPFLNDLGFGHYVFDFEAKGVTSVSADPHKMGLGPIPSGCILFKSEKHLEAITRKVPYLRGLSAVQTTLLGTRPAGSILAAWAVMKHLGRSGYRSIVEQCMTRTIMIKERVESSAMLDLAIEPVMNIIGIKTREIPIEHAAERMEERGWRMATSPLPPTIRVVVMPHITEGTINAFLNDLEEIAGTIPPD